MKRSYCALAIVLLLGTITESRAIRRVQPQPKYVELPVYNDHKGRGGYVAIYTSNKEEGVYSVGKDTYVVALLRVPGEYKGGLIKGRLFTSYLNAEELKNRASKYVNMKGKWFGGDTGGFLMFRRGRAVLPNKITIETAE